jgi:hypothetical protein
VDLTVDLTFTFAADSGPDDPTSRFLNGRTARVVIPRGSTTGSVDLQAGTVAGNITVTAQLLADTTDVTIPPAPRLMARINPAAPQITSVTATRNAGVLTIVIVGYSTSREVQQATFQFVPGPGLNLQTTQITVSVESQFSAWYQSAASTAFGSQFSFTQTFTIQGTAVATVPSITVVLGNRIGNSGPAPANVQ